MKSVTTKLTEELLSLPCEDRIYLADRLLESLNAPTRENIEQAWAEEAERRIEEIESGNVDTIPGEQVFREIRERLRK